MRITTVAYLAPEIPSTSATFVYNEILAVQKKGLQVIPISIHKIRLQSDNAELKDLAQNTFCLYSRSWLETLHDNLTIFLKKPNQYLRAFF